MKLTQITVLLQTEIPEARCVRCHFGHLVVDENGMEVARDPIPELVTLYPDGEDRAARLGVINAELARRGKALISDSEWARATGHCDVEHTKEVIAAYLERK